MHGEYNVKYSGMSPSSLILSYNAPKLMTRRKGKAVPLRSMKKWGEGLEV
jgi:hypothetical protein